MHAAKFKTTSFYSAIIILLGMVCLSGCGIKGDLNTPPPLWGDAKSEADNPAERNPVLDDSPINNNEDNDIFGDDYIEETEPF